MTCEGEDMLLECTGSKRVAIYSAMFGRSGDRSMDSSNSKCPNQGDPGGEVGKSTIICRNRIASCGCVM